MDELRALLEAAAAQAPDVLPLLAIGAFAGLRDAEIKRLDWSEVDLARGFIEVKAAKQKARGVELLPYKQSRCVAISGADRLTTWPPSAKRRAQQACSGP